MCKPDKPRPRLQEQLDRFPRRKVVAKPAVFDGWRGFLHRLLALEMQVSEGFLPRAQGDAQGFAGDVRQGCAGRRL